MLTSETRPVLYAVFAGWIGNAAGQAEGSLLIKRVDDALSEVVEVDARTGANGGFAVGSVDGGKARCNVCFLLGPKTWAMVSLSARRE